MFWPTPIWVSKPISVGVVPLRLLVSKSLRCAAKRSKGVRSIARRRLGRRVWARPSGRHDEKSRGVGSTASVEGRVYRNVIAVSKPISVGMVPLKLLVSRALWGARNHGRWGSGGDGGVEGRGEGRGRPPWRRAARELREQLCHLGEQADLRGNRAGQIAVLEQAV